MSEKQPFNPSLEAEKRKEAARIDAWMGPDGHNNPDTVADLDKYLNRDIEETVAEDKTYEEMGYKELTKLLVDSSHEKSIKVSYVNKNDKVASRYKKFGPDQTTAEGVTDALASKFASSNLSEDGILNALFQLGDDGGKRSGLNDDQMQEIAVRASELREHREIEASIVEREVNNPEDRAKVAQVFLKRLREGIPLGSDPTALNGALNNESYRSNIFDFDEDEGNVVDDQELPESVFIEPEDGENEIQILDIDEEDDIERLQDEVSGNVATQELEKPSSRWSRVKNYFYGSIIRTQTALGDKLTVQNDGSEKNKMSRTRKFALGAMAVGTAIGSYKLMQQFDVFDAITEPVGDLLNGDTDSGNGNKNSGQDASELDNSDSKGRNKFNTKELLNEEPDVKFTLENNNSSTKVIPGENGEFFVESNNGEMIPTDAKGNPINANTAVLATPDALVVENSGTVLQTSDVASTATEAVNTAIGTSSEALNIVAGNGFEDTFQQVYGLTDEQAARMYAELAPKLAKLPGTYLENGQVLISAPGYLDISSISGDIDEVLKVIKT